MRRSLWLVFSMLKVSLAEWFDSHNPYGMEHFVTRPELTAPRYMVATHRPEAVTPGYWFVTPYTKLGSQARTNRLEYIPCQTGAHIYDGNGTLIWSGACKYDNRNAFGFHPVDVNGEQQLALWIAEDNADELPEADIVINNQYEETARMERPEKWVLDGHEFNVLPGGNTALVATWLWEEVNATDIGLSTQQTQSNGFREVHISSGDVIFEWAAFDHVTLNESCDTEGMARVFPEGEFWDWFHLNSVDKNAHGDYLVSARHTSAIYKVSHDDGHIIWRLGGCYDNSDFVMDDDVIFHWQHHARFRFENETHTIISLFDNANEQPDLNPNIPDAPSSGKIVILDHTSDPPTAKLLRRFYRPDGGGSSFLGSVQTIGDRIETANVFINWAFQGYITEHDAQDNLIFEAKFESDRSRSYRAFKSPFAGRPTELPVLKILPIGFTQDKEKIASALFVSWNGATEVAQWAFYGADVEDGSFRLLTTVDKDGFETSWVTPGKVNYAYAEALDISGHVLGTSDTATILSASYGDFKISNPLLEKFGPVRQPLDEPPSPSPDSNFEGCYIVESTKYGSEESARKAFEKAPYVVISGLVLCGFALFGFYQFVLNIVRIWTWKRKGYMALSKYR